jgi:hypothetical protein
MHVSEQDRERFRAIGGYKQFDKNAPKPPEHKPGKELFDKYLLCAARSKELTPEEWCARGVCPECIHDMVICADGQFCPECGFFTKLIYLSPAERDQG